MKKKTLTGLLMLIVVWLCYANDVRVAWNASTSLVKFRVYVGIGHGDYTNSYDAGTNTAFVITNLDPFLKYYMAVTAYNDSNESDFSNEIYWHTTNWVGTLPPEMRVDWTNTPFAAIRVRDFTLYSGANADSLSPYGKFTFFIKVPATNSMMLYRVSWTNDNPPLKLEFFP